MQRAVQPEEVPHSAQNFVPAGLVVPHPGQVVSADNRVPQAMQYVAPAGLSRLSEADEDQKKENEQVWEHVKSLRRRVASMN